MDPEFQKVLLRVALVGGSVGVMGTIALVIAFRAFAPKEERRSDFRAIVIGIAAIAFILVCCIVLLIFSRTR